MVQDGVDIIEDPQDVPGPQNRQDGVDQGVPCASLHCFRRGPVPQRLAEVGEVRPEAWAGPNDGPVPAAGDLHGGPGAAAAGRTLEKGYAPVEEVLDHAFGQAAPGEKERRVDRRVVVASEGEGPAHVRPL